MAKLDYFRKRFCSTLAKNYFNKRTKLEAVRALTYSLSQNCWDTFVSPCPLKVGVQDLVTEPRKTTLRGTRGAREGKKQRLV